MNGKMRDYLSVDLVAYLVRSNSQDRGSRHRMKIRPDGQSPAIHLPQDDTFISCLQKEKYRRKYFPLLKI